MRGQRHRKPMGIFRSGGFSSRLAARLVERDEWWFDEPLAAALARFFQGKTVGDFGAGIGRYAEFLNAHGVDCRGYDAIPGIDALTGGRVVHFDLCPASPETLSRTFDWVLCLEVMEHIPAELESVALANLDRLNTCGLVISWAVPGQGGQGHVNEQPNRHAIGWFTARGYAHDGNSQQLLRRGARIDWFKSSLMVFRRLDG